MHIYSEGYPTAANRAYSLVNVYWTEASVWMDGSKMDPAAIVGNKSSNP